MIHTIDATGKSLGRVASAAAAILIGKDTRSFSRNKKVDISVHIANASKAHITAKKIREKTYTRYSGYPGGLKYESLEKVIINKGTKEVFRRAVEGMLPKNKLKKQMMKNLKISE